MKRTFTLEELILQVRKEYPDMNDYEVTASVHILEHEGYLKKIIGDIYETTDKKTPWQSRIIIDDKALEANRTYIFPDTKHVVMSEYERRECTTCEGPFMANIEKNQTVCPRCVEIANLKDNGC